MNEAIRNVLELKGNDVETVSPDVTVLAAVEQMNRAKIGALLVVDGQRLIGIFTERDVLTRVVAKRLDPELVPVGEVMTRSLVTIPATMTVAEALVVVTHRRCRHLPVFEGDELCGVVSIGDLTSWIVRDQQRTITDLYDYLRCP
jgi:CBS domain-containing protein